MATYSGIISNASDFVKAGVIGDAKRWIMLIIFMIIQAVTLSIIPLLNGYLVRVYSESGDTAPEADGFGRLFVDGWKLNIITILYLIPAILIAIIFGALSLLPLISGIMEGKKVFELSGLLLGSIGIMLAIIIFLLITLVMYMGYVHFSRTGSLFDAFSVGQLISKISDGVGWGSYILIWILVWVMSVILFLIITGLSVIPFLGIIAGMILAPIWGVFIAKIFSNVYDNRP